MPSDADQSRDLIPTGRLTPGEALEWHLRHHRGLNFLLRSGYILKQLVEYIRAHPIIFTLQILGLVTLVSAVATVPILGAAGFTSLGPAAGSAAAGWQAGIGIVEAGSLFAWCQSAAMGGAAVGAITTTAVVGGVVAIVPGVVHVASEKINEVGNAVKDKLQRLWKW